MKSKSRLSVEFFFALQDKVKILEINRPGVVIGVTFGESGKQYQVVYWNDGTRNATWVYDWEIELVN